MKQFLGKLLFALALYPRYEVVIETQNTLLLKGDRGLVCATDMKDRGINIKTDFGINFTMNKGEYTSKLKQILC